MSERIHIEAHHLVTAFDGGTLNMEQVSRATSVGLPSWTSAQSSCASVSKRNSSTYVDAEME